MAVTPEAWEGWRAKGSSMFLEAGDVVPLADLLTGIATVSANDAAYVVAEQAAGSLAGWTALMNARARGLGMTQSHFGTPNGWPDEGRTFTTAHDLVILAKALVERHPEQFARFIGQREYRYRDITQPNRDPLIGRVAGADGIKTGYTNEAGYNFLGTAQRGGQRLVVVIAGADRGSTRAKAARDLIEWGFAAFDRKALFDKGAVVGTARVQDGSLRSLDLVAERAVAVNVPKGAGADMRVEIVYEGPLRAPIRAGETVAMLEVTAPDMEPARIPLLAARDIGQAGLLSRIANAFAGWLG
jgi:D-alanyl-D-alanine carboxypeptidase (penicillin-binding protein 5/6)